MGKLDNMMVYALERKIDKLEQQRSELLEALKLLHRNFRSQHASLLILGAPDFVYMDKVADQAITRAAAQIQLDKETA